MNLQWRKTSLKQVDLQGLVIYSHIFIASMAEPVDVGNININININIKL